MGVADGQRGVALAALLLSVLGSFQATAQTTNLLSGGDTVFVGYDNGSDGPQAGNSPVINLGFGDSGTYAAVTMDTGSTGIVVSRDVFTPGPDATDLGPGKQIYSSSGRIMEGTWYTATENIYDANGNLVAKADVPVLRVTKIECEAGARNCQPDNDPKHVGVMGIGFDRESGSADPARHTPDYNAFLNLTSVAGPNGTLVPLPADWHNGYEVTPTGVYIGLTSSITSNASLVKLLPNTTYSEPGLPEWESVPMTITVNGQSVSGHVLMDTGLTTGLLSDPAYQGTLSQCPSAGEGGDKCLPAGTMVALSLPGQAHPAAYYTFTVDQSNTDMQPNGGVALDSNDSKLFNTSVSVLNGITFFYDEENGFIGYINNAGSPFFVHVNPQLSLEGPWGIGDGFYTSMPTYLFGATTLEPEGTATFAGRLQGNAAGSLVIEGPGTVNLTGGAALEAPIAVQQGTLAVNSVVSAPLLSVGASGTLAGNGVLAAPVRIAGTLAPGNNAPGSLTIDAPVTMQPTGTLRIDLGGTGNGTGPGNYSRLWLFGSKSSFTAAGTLAPILTSSGGEISANFVPSLGQTFAVVDAEGGIKGSFAALTQPDGLASGTRLDALYGSNEIELVVTPSDYGNLASLGITETRNQSAIGTLLDVVRPEGGQMTAAQQALFQTLYTLPADSITAAINQLSPEIYADALMTTRNAWYLMAGAVGGQLGARRGLAQTNNAAAAEGPNGSIAWMSGLGETSNTAGNDNNSGFSTGLGGAAFGFDVPLGQSFRLGVAAGGTGGQTNADAGGQSTSETAQLETYGQWQSGMFFAEAQLGVMYQHMSVDRTLSVFGLGANGTTDGWGGGGSLQIGISQTVDSWLIQPSVGFGGFAFSQNNLTETGAGVLSETVGNQNLASAQSTVGASVQRSFALSDSVQMVGKGQFGWAYEFADNSANVSANFAGFAGNGFLVTSAPIGRNAALVGLDTDFHVADWPVAIFAGYGGAYNGSSNTQAFTAGLRFNW